MSLLADWQEEYGFAYIEWSYNKYLISPTVYLTFLTNSDIGNYNPISS